MTDLENRFIYHKASPSGTTRHQELSALFIELATRIDAICPDGREKSLVLTHLEEAKMWASAAVARNQDTR